MYNTTRRYNSAKRAGVNTMRAIVHMVAGQSNAAGQYSASNLTRSEFSADYPATKYICRRVEKDTLVIEEDLTYGPLRLDSAGKMGVEMIIGRALQLEIKRISDDQQIVLLKYTSNGVSLSHFRQATNVSGFYTAFVAWITDQVAFLEQEYDSVEFGRLFWLQGESESSAAAAPVYGLLFASFLEDLNAVISGSFTPIWGNLKENRGVDSDVYAADINTQMSSAYRNSGSSDDYTTTDAIHYDPDSLLAMGEAMFKA